MNALFSGLRNTREFCPGEGFPAWCMIEDLSMLCGYDPVAQFSLLRELPDAYPARSGRDPSEIAEEHPVEALAMAVRRFLAEYPEIAEELAAAAQPAVPAELRPERAA